MTDTSQVKDISAPELPYTAQKRLWFGHRTGWSIASERRMKDPMRALKINMHGKVSYTTHLLQVMMQCHSLWKQNFVSIKINWQGWEWSKRCWHVSQQQGKGCFYTKVLFTVTDFLTQVQQLEPPHHTTPCIVKVREIVLNKVSGKNIRMIILASKWVLMVTLNIVSRNQRSMAERVMAICS